jgi:hypothetical protein
LAYSAVLEAVLEWERPLVEAFEVWMRAERAKLSRHAEVAKAMGYMLRRWTPFTRFLEDGRVCLSNNAAERARRGIALHWVAKPGSSPAPSVAASAPQSCTR